MLYGKLGINTIESTKSLYELVVLDKKNSRSLKQPAIYKKSNV